MAHSFALLQILSTRALIRPAWPGAATAALFVSAILGSAVAAAQAQNGDLDRIRSRALQLVNEDRREAGLPELSLGPDLNEAAQFHAEDMLRRDYYAHTSPEGADVQNRFVQAGGSRWQLVAENLARCSECGDTLSVEMLERLHRGWMRSPSHRENILARGLERFGFGFAASDAGGLYAVQTFAGPGIPRGLQSSETASPVNVEAAAEEILMGINRARREAGVPTVELNPSLTTAAEKLLPGERGGFRFDETDLFALLPQDSRREWAKIAVAAGECSGCGVEPTGADVRSFRKQWLDDPHYSRTLLDEDFTHLGFAIQANEEGRKTAALVMGRMR